MLPEEVGAEFSRPSLGNIFWILEFRPLVVSMMTEFVEDDFSVKELHGGWPPCDLGRHVYLIDIYLDPSGLATPFLVI